jgi:hypothetical protein
MYGRPLPTWYPELLANEIAAGDDSWGLLEYMWCDAAEAPTGFDRPYSIFGKNITLFITERRIMPATGIQPTMLVPCQ